MTDEALLRTAEPVHGQSADRARREVLWFPAIWDLIEGVFYAAADGRGDPARVEAARAALAQRYDALDKELAGREFLCAVRSAWRTSRRSSW
jgi:glutathione S-transferase